MSLSRYDICCIRADVRINVSASFVANPAKSDSSCGSVKNEDVEVIVIFRRLGRYRLLLVPDIPLRLPEHV